MLNKKTISLFLQKKAIMFNALSEETQLTLVIIGIALLFIIVIWNSKRNKKKLYSRDQRNFRKNYQKKSDKGKMY